MRRLPNMEVNVPSGLASTVYLSTPPSYRKADKGTFIVYTAIHTMFNNCCKDSAKPEL